jgi:seryl-tRNA synthetase
MIDIDHLRSNPELYTNACKLKRINLDISALLALDERYRALKTKVETRRSESNAFNKQLPTLKGAERDAKLSEMKSFAAETKELDGQLAALELERKGLLLRVPGIPLPTVPNGASDADNVEARKVGALPEFSFQPKSHIEIGAKLGIIDVERGVKLAGSRAYFLKGDGARLQHAVMSFAIDLVRAKEYTLMDPPHIVRREVMEGTGYFPGGEEQAYHLDERDKEYHLIGTAEVPVTAYHSDETLPIAALPLRYSGYSPCYRREAGTYGKDTAGLYRVHQFYKVEQVVICRNDAAESAKFHEELLGNSEALLKALELPYRVVNVCTGDMGQGQIFKNDIETWMPSRKSYGETHSCSTFHEFQARRLNLKYKDAEGKLQYCHTLNNTLVASPRILIALLEIHQTADGNVRIPKVLQPYMGGQEVIA